MDSNTPPLLLQNLFRRLDLSEPTRIYPLSREGWGRLQNPQMRLNAMIINGTRD